MKKLITIAIISFVILILYFVLFKPIYKEKKEYPKEIFETNEITMHFDDIEEKQNIIRSDNLSKLPIDGEYIILDGNNFLYPVEVLEFNNIVIVLDQGKKIVAYNIEENKKLYELQLLKSEKAFSPMFFKYDKKEGYDYCVAYDDQIIFLNSKDHTIFYSEILPVELNRPEILYSERIYTFTENHFVFLTEDGINVVDKSNSKNFVLKNENIKEYIFNNSVDLNLCNSIGSVETVKVFDVQFLKNGEKIGFCATNMEYSLMFFGIYNIVTNEIEIIVSYNENFSAKYPAFSERVTFSDYTSVIVLNVFSFDTIKYHFNKSNYVIPEKHLSIVYSIHKNERLGLEIYYCPDDNYDDMNKPFIKINDENVKCDVVAICNKFTYLKVYFASKEYLIAVKNMC